MKDAELIAKLAAVRQLTERLNLNFEQILADALRRFPPDSVRVIRAKLDALAEPAAQSRR